MAGGGSHAAAAADANTHVVFRRLGIVLLSLLRGLLAGGAASDSRDQGINWLGQNCLLRGKCYLIFQLTITITVHISVDNNNCPYTGQLLKK